MHTTRKHLFLQCVLSIFSINLIFGQISSDLAVQPTHKVVIDYKYYLQKAQNRSLRNAMSVELFYKGMRMPFVAIPNNVYEDQNERSDDPIFTFDLTHAENKDIKGALTLSNYGLFATIIENGKLTSVYPEDMFAPDIHIVEEGITQDWKLKQGLFCEHDHSLDELVRKPSPFNKNGLRNGITMGSRRFNYRMAVAVTGEYYVGNGNTDNSVRTAVTQTVNAMHAIINTEMSLGLSIANNRIFLYRDASADPFIPDQMGGASRPDQAGQALAMNINANNYDIGHVFHKHEDGDGWSNGGVAQLNSVCSNNGTPISKARGWSGSYQNVGNGWVSLAMHEIAHQFGARHTFNADGSSCTSNISATTAVEIGSGTTLMSYNGLCDPAQNIPSSDILDNYFHVVSLGEMYEFVYNGVGGSCGGGTATPNDLPSVQANPCNANYTIPLSTPFYLEAKGTFTDNDNHTYCWEQIDEDGPGTPTQGKIGTAAAGDVRAPLFRSYPPKQVPFRYFPALEVITQGFNQFEVLSTRARTMRFNVAMRDNNTQGGAVANDDILVNVASSGPFVISRPSGGEVFAGGTNDVISWATNGSNSLCSKVRIKLSTDNGKTYSVIIADNVDYAAGSYNFTWPNNMPSTTEARVMIECMDYDCFKFFTISANKFTVNTSCNLTSSLLCPDSDISVDQGDPTLQLMHPKIVGERLTSGIFTISGANTMRLTVRGVGNIGCERLQQSQYHELRFIPEKSGTYTFTVDRRFDDGFGFISIFRASNFSTTNPCGSFVGSSGTWTGTGSEVNAGTKVTVTLEACTPYVIAMYNYTKNRVSITNISGPGIVFRTQAIPMGMDVTFAAINNVTNTVAFVSSNADFITLESGSYRVVSLSYASNLNPSTFVGQNFNSLVLSNCVLLGLGSRNLEIISACKINEIAVGVQTPCQVGPNTYTQEVIVSYDRAPDVGQLSVNGQLFPITSSPQSVILTNLDSDGLPLNVTAFFTEAPNCQLTKVNLFNAPVNCCPINLELDNDIDACESEIVTLDAGNDGVSYAWSLNGTSLPQTSNKINATLPGKYSVLVTHSSGCSKSDTITLTFHPKPVITLPTQQDFCQGETFILSPTITNGAIIKWYKDNVIIPDATTSTLSITEPGSYRIEVLSNFDCFAEHTITMREISAPIVTLGEDINACENDEVELFAGEEGVVYEWYKDGTIIPGALLNTYIATASGNYRVVVTNTGLCTAQSSVEVRFFSSPIVRDFTAITEFCENVPSKIIAAQASGFSSLQWYFNDSPINMTNALTLEVFNSGSYSIEATNLAGCKTRKTTRVEIRPLPNVNIGPPTLIACKGNPVTLDGGQDGTAYLWSLNSVILPQSSRLLVVNNNGTYTITVTNQFNCTKSDTTVVTFIDGPTLELNGNKTICEGESHVIELTTNASNPVIKWYNAQGLLRDQTGPTLLVTESGEYRVELTGGNPPCAVSKSVNITVNPVPAVNLGANQNLCEGDMAPILNVAQSNSTYNWLLNGVPISTEPQVTATTGGVYQVEVTNSFNCSKNGQVIITYNPLPTLEVGDSYDLCESSTLPIVVTSNGQKFEWKRNGVVINNQNTSTLNVTLDGNYTVRAISNKDCSVEKPFVVVTRPNPIVNLGQQNLTLCPREMITLDAGIHDQYLWSDNSTGKTLDINAGAPTMITNSVYSVTVTNTFACTATSTVNVTVNPVVTAEIQSSQPGVCNGQPVSLTASGGIIYSWRNPGDNSLSSLNTANTIANPKSTTTYFVVVSDEICVGNTAEASIEIKVFTPMNISAGPDTCVTEGRTIRLGASGGIAYEWNNVQAIIGSNTIANPEVQPLVETIFVVTITDNNGCKYQDSVKVCVKIGDFKAISMLTPNGDGMNDELDFGNLSDYPNNKLTIYNRWGNIVFETQNYQIRGPLFDGTKNGERLPADTYYYVLVLGDEIIKSSLTILWD